jgi:cysteine-rich repeat protein
MRLGCLLMIAVLAVTAHAADHPVQGDLLRLRDPAVAAGRRMRFVAARDPAIVPGASNDPRDLGASLAIGGTGPGDGSSGTVGLEARFWTGLGTPPGSKGFRYANPAGAGGVRKVVLRPGMLVIAGGGSRWPYLIGRPQGDVEMRFAVGADVYCASFTRFVQNRPGRVLARNAPAPPGCSGGGPAPRCGDGVIEPTEECDDANTADGDGCSAGCLREDLPCGNGVLEPGEECDDHNRHAGDGCSPTCRLEACTDVPGVPGTALTTVLVASGLAAPVHVAAPRLDPTRLFVVEQAGRVRVIRDGVLLPDAFLDVARKVSCCGEQGLLSIAFHPDYAANGRFFIFYTNTDGDEVVARYRVSPDLDRADDTSEEILITVPDFAANHNGGQLAFGPDGHLYVGIGDGGGGGDPQETGQDLTRLLGKLLRLDVDVDVAPYYAVPPTNPFVGHTDARGEIWAYGLRNPWRFGFDRATGDLYVGDVGQGSWEEIDAQPAASAGGENYGWDVFEAWHCYEPTPPATGCPSPPTGFTMPVLEYDHGEGCSVTGGFVYRGCAMPDLRGTYFYADYCTAFIRTFRGVSGGDAVETADRTAELAPGMGLSIDSPTSFGEDARGELYIADYGGEIFKIVRAP